MLLMAVLPLTQAQMKRVRMKQQLIPAQKQLKKLSLNLS
jgi:hypothetical protein